MGRPSKDLHVVIGVLLLQQLHDLSDAETVEALAFNMAWHYALDVRSEADSYFCEKTLRNYRRLFIEQGLDELLFRCLTDRLVQGFSVDTSHQRMDSTALRSAMRALTRLGIVVETISKFARELERYHPGLHEQISKEVIRRYVEEGLVLRCPNNVEPVSASLAKAKLQARFDLSICQKCPDILRCPVQAAKRDGQFSRFQYTPARAANQKRRLYEQSDAFRDVYRWRAGIEATMSRLKYQMNLAHLRIRGMPAMRYVVNLRALGLNIRRCAAIAP